MGLGPKVNNAELNVIASTPNNVYRVPYSELPQYGGRLYQSWRAYPRTPGNVMLCCIGRSNHKLEVCNCIDDTAWMQMLYKTRFPLSNLTQIFKIKLIAALEVPLEF